MRRLPLAFFTVAALCAMVGMVWGMIMGRTENFTMAPAHAHLNLLGWTTLAIMGGFYALAGERAPKVLGWLNFVLSSVAVAIFIPALANLLGGDRAAMPFIVGGASVALAGMVAFFLAIILTWREPGPPSGV